MSKMLTLDFEEEIEYSMIGIASNLKDYRLSFYLNRLPNFQFKRVESFVFKKKDQIFDYSLYVFLDNTNLRNFYLIANKSKSVNLIKDYKHFDYVLIMDGEINDDFLKEVSSQIKQADGIIITSILNDSVFDKVKGLRTAFEIHLDKVLTSI